MPTPGSRRLVNISHYDMQSNILLIEILSDIHAYRMRAIYMGPYAPPTPSNSHGHSDESRRYASASPRSHLIFILLLSAETPRRHAPRDRAGRRMSTGPRQEARGRYEYFEGLILGKRFHMRIRDVSLTDDTLLSGATLDERAPDGAVPQQARPPSGGYR
jgi:hypothetical protein